MMAHPRDGEELLSLLGCPLRPGPSLRMVIRIFDLSGRQVCLRLLTWLIERDVVCRTMSWIDLRFWVLALLVST